jgi:hypothetical protein
MASLEELTTQLREYMAQNAEKVKTSFDRVEVEIGTLMGRLAYVEDAIRNGRDGGRDGGTSRSKKSLIHIKNLTPTVLSQPEHWKKWKGDIEEYLEELVPGFKDMLEKVKKSEEEVDQSWFNDVDDLWWDYADQLWRLLRRYSEGEARRVIMSVGNDNGWDAWRKLHQQFEPSVVMREAQAMAQFTGMVNRRAKNPAETRSLMLELDERARRVEEMTEAAPDDRHVMSVIMGILDGETLKHTIHFQGMKKSVSELKRKVLEFVNLTAPSKGDAMDIGRVEGRGGSWERVEEEEEWDEEQLDDDDNEHINGFGEKCYNCNGYGHYSRECPLKGKGKGKSKGKGKGETTYGTSKGKGKYGKAPFNKGKGKGQSKGKGKGPATGCFTCGGAHYANACPNSTPNWGPSESLRTLCNLQEVLKPIDDDGFQIVLKKKRGPQQPRLVQLRQGAKVAEVEGSSAAKAASSNKTNPGSGRARLYPLAPVAMISSQAATWQVEGAKAASSRQERTHARAAPATQNKYPKTGRCPKGRNQSRRQQHGQSWCRKTAVSANHLPRRGKLRHRERRVGADRASRRLRRNRDSHRRGDASQCPDDGRRSLQARSRI